MLCAHRGCGGDSLKAPAALGSRTPAVLPDDAPAGWGRWACVTPMFLPTPSPLGVGLGWKERRPKCGTHSQYGMRSGSYTCLFAQRVVPYSSSHLLSTRRSSGSFSIWAQCLPSQLWPCASTDWQLLHQYWNLNAPIQLPYLNFGINWNKFELICAEADFLSLTALENEIKKDGCV